jgi:hypothetical protein
MYRGRKALLKQHPFRFHFRTALRPLFKMIVPNLFEMNQEQDKVKKSRRRFLSLGLLAGAGLLAGNLDAQTNAVVENTGGKKTKMLTPDGQLVEVDENVLALAQQKSKATNQDILNWSTTTHDKTKA